MARGTARATHVLKTAPCGTAPLSEYDPSMRCYGMTGIDKHIWNTVFKGRKAMSKRTISKLVTILSAYVMGDFEAPEAKLRLAVVLGSAGDAQRVFHKFVK